MSIHLQKGTLMQCAFLFLIYLYYRRKENRKNMSGFRNNTCENDCCIPTVKSQAVAVVGSALQITLPDNLTTRNCKEWKLLICQCIPDSADTLAVQFVVNGTAYPVLSRIGNTLRGDMIRSRTCYRIAYGWDSPHFIILSCNLCCTSFIPASAVTPTPASEKEISAQKNAKQQ